MSLPVFSPQPNDNPAIASVEVRLTFSAPDDKAEMRLYELKLRTHIFDEASVCWYGALDHYIWQFAPSEVGLDTLMFGLRDEVLEFDYQTSRSPVTSTSIGGGFAVTRGVRIRKLNSKVFEEAEFEEYRLGRAVERL